jgi:L-rhamnose mutarotase
MCSGLSTSSRLSYFNWPHVEDEAMKQYLREHEDVLFPKAAHKITESNIDNFVKLFDSSFNELLSFQNVSDLDSEMREKLDQRVKYLESIRTFKKKEEFDVLKKLYRSKNYQAHENLIGNPHSVEKMVNLNLITYKSENYCVFHDRLTLEAMKILNP